MSESPTACKVRLTLDEIAQMKEDYYVGTADAANMVRLEHIARRVPIEIAAELQKSFPHHSPIRPTAERVVGICHLFDDFERSINRAITKEYPPHSMMPIEFPTEHDKKFEEKLEEIRDAVDRMGDLIDRNGPQELGGFAVLNMLAPYKAVVEGNMMELEWNSRDPIVKSLRRIWNGAHGIGAHSDSGLARSALTYLDDRLSRLHYQTAWPKLLDRTLWNAYRHTYARYKHAKFTAMFAEDLLQFHLPHIFVTKLGIFPRMVQGMVRDMPEGHPRYSATIARCWAQDIDARDGEDAYTYAREMHHDVYNPDKQRKTEFSAFDRKAADFILKVVAENQGHINKILLTQPVRYA